MRIVMLLFGSRGDVQPWMALGRGLTAAGYEVRVATHTNHESFVRENGLGYAPVGGDMRDLMPKLMATGRNPVTFAQEWMDHFLPIWDETTSAFEQVSQGADAIIGNTFGIFGYHVAELLRIPFIVSNPYPFSPTRALPAFMFPLQLPLGGNYNLLTHHLFFAVQAEALRTKTNDWRVEHGLPPHPFLGYPYRRLNGRDVLTLNCYSEHIVPRPADWGPAVQTTGYWFLDAAKDWQTPQDLTDFLNNGPPPVYIGFGSLNGDDFAVIADVVLEALEIAGLRGLLLTGWGGLGNGNLPDTVYKIDAAPHDWLFPHMAAVVHHGGAGTTAAGLRAGKPTVVVPFFGDQPFWGEQVAARGVGPQPVPRWQLNANDLAYAMRVATSHGPIRQRAAEMGAKIRAEDGVARAVELINDYLN